MVLCVLAGCSAETTGHAAWGIVKGRVSLGPIMPVCHEGVACDGVYAGARIVVRAQSGKLGARATADQKGEFSLDISPGEYVVAVEADGSLPRCSRADVIVTAGRTTQANIDCDTGIR